MNSCLDQSSAPTVPCRPRQPQQQQARILTCKRAVPRSETEANMDLAKALSLSMCSTNLLTVEESRLKTELRLIDDQLKELRVRTERPFSSV